MVFGPYPARVVEVTDGDTVILDLDLGFAVALLGKGLGGRGRTQLSCRVWGINAPDKPPAQREASKAYAESLLKPGDLASVLSHFWDKFGGRFDGEIKMSDGRDFAAEMVLAGQAVYKAYVSKP